MIVPLLLLAAQTVKGQGPSSWPYETWDDQGYVRMIDVPGSEPTAPIYRSLRAGNLDRAETEAAALVRRRGRLVDYRAQIDVARTRRRLPELFRSWERAGLPSGSTRLLAWAWGRAIEASEIRAFRGPASEVLAALRFHEKSNDVFVLIAVGGALGDLGSLAEGRKILERAVALRPKFDRLRMVAATSYTRSATQDLSRETGSMLARARAYNEANRERPDLAMKHLRIATNGKSTYAPAYLLLGGLEEAKGMNRDAIAHYKLYLRYTKDSSERRSSIEREIEKLRKKVA